MSHDMDMGFVYALIGFLIFIVGIGLGSFIGEKDMEEKMINSLCNKNQYDFCQPVTTYTRKVTNE